MFPIRDHNPSRSTPYVTLALIALNVGVYLLLTLPRAGNDLQLAMFYRQWGLVPAFAEPLNYVTSMFLHGGLVHLAGNMLFLWVFGDNLEDEMGPLPYLGFYLATGVLATLLHVALAPNSTVPLVGASGAIAGVMGGYLLLYPRARIDVLFIFFIFFRIWPIPAWIVLLAWFGLQLLNGTASAGAEGGVAYWAHVGGFVAGAVLALPVWLREGGTRWWSRTAGQPPHEETAYPNLSPTRIPTVRRRRK